MAELISYLFTLNPKTIFPDVGFKFLMILQTIGVAFVTYSITLVPDISNRIKEIIDDKKELNTEEKETLNHLRSTLLIFRYCQLFGTSYFLAIIILCLKFTLRLFSDSQNNTLIEGLMNGFGNAAVVLTITPTILICMTFLFHKISARKLEGKTLIIRFYKYILLD